MVRVDDDRQRSPTYSSKEPYVLYKEPYAFRARDPSLETVLPVFD